MIADGAPPSTCLVHSGFRLGHLRAIPFAHRRLGSSAASGHEQIRRFLGKADRPRLRWVDDNSGLVRAANLCLIRWLR